jgi:hypothetical protein
MLSRRFGIRTVKYLTLVHTKETPMNQPLMSFVLVLLIEVICAVASYLKDRLMRHMSQRDHGYDFCADTEYA